MKLKIILILCVIGLLVLGTSVKDAYTNEDWTYSFKVENARVHKTIDMKVILREAKKITPPTGYKLQRVSVNYNSNDPRNITTVTCHYTLKTGTPKVGG